MGVIEFVAGPGSGKTTLATGLYCYYKQYGATGLDFAREIAQDYTNKGCGHKLRNQALLAAKEYDRLLSLRYNGCKVLITDTSINLGKVYGMDFKHKDALFDLIDSIRTEFEFKTVFVQHVKPYVSYGRGQTEAEAKGLDSVIREVCGPFDAVVPGNMEGLERLKNIVIREDWLAEVLYKDLPPLAINEDYRR